MNALNIKMGKQVVFKIKEDNLNNVVKKSQKKLEFNLQ